MNEAVGEKTSADKPKGEARPARLRKRYRRWRHGLLPSTSYKRLADDLPVSTRELASLIARLEGNRSGNEAKLLLLGEAKEMLERSEAALEEGNPELGWRWFKASARLRVYAMTDEELLARARSILNEASDDKKGVTAWRKAVIKQLLADKEGKLDENLKEADKVAHAAKILDEHHDNVYQKLTILRARLAVLALLTAVALVVWVLVLPQPAGPAAATDIPVGPRMFWCTIILSGVIGAIISGFTSSITKRGGEKRIPIELDFSAITFARLALGALSALAVTAFLSAGLVKLGEPSYELTLAAAIVSGFSERLLLRALESAGG